MASALGFGALPLWDPMAQGETLDLTKEKVSRFQDFWDTEMQALREEERAEHMTPIQGNLYLFWAIKDFAFDSGIFRLSQQPQFGVLAAMWLIPLLQIFTPACLLCNTLLHIHFGNEHEQLFGIKRFFAYENLCQRFLGLFFLGLFLLNGLFVLQKNKRDSEKITEMMILFRGVEHYDKDHSPKAHTPAGDRPGTCVGRPKWQRPRADRGLPITSKMRPCRDSWLWIGALVNSTSLILCSLTMVFLFVIEDGPKDLVLDAFGLNFVYNLDDFGGDLAFMSARRWNEDYMGKIYGGMREAGVIQQAKEERRRKCTPDALYTLSMKVVNIFCVVLPLVYMFVEMDIVRDDSE